MKLTVLSLLVLVASCATPSGDAPATPVEMAAQARAALVHVEQPDPGSPLLQVDTAAIADSVDDVKARSLLAPLASQIVDLSLARTHVSAASADWLLQCQSLRRLDVRACTRVDDAFVRAIVALPQLEELVLARTATTDASIDALLASSSLKRVWMWKCAVTPAGFARLAARDGLLVDAGLRPSDSSAEVEPKPEFVNLLPMPGEPALEAALVPINVNCPVTGAPVDAKRTRTVNGRVVGFCCNNCPKTFDADPAKYEAALPKP